MRKQVLFSLICFVFLSSAAVLAGPVTFNFSSVGNAQIVFDGSGGFHFQNSTATGSGYDFQIGVGPASLTGLLGDITGNFTIGAITVSGSTESAPVTGSGSFNIWDGTGWFTADLDWVNISTTGTGSTLNSTATVNLSNFSYSGSNTALLDLAGDGSGKVTVTFQFILPPVPTLTDLKTEGGTNSYSGAVTSVPVPEPGTLSLLLLGLGCLAIRRRK